MICSIIIGSCSYIEKGNINFRVVANLLWTERLNNSTNSSKSEYLPLTSSHGIQNRQRHLLMKIQVLAWDRHTNVAGFFLIYWSISVLPFYIYWTISRGPIIGSTRASFFTCPIPGPGFPSTNVVFFCSVQWIGVKHNYSFCWHWWNCLQELPHFAKVRRVNVFTQISIFRKYSFFVIIS